MKKLPIQPIILCGGSGTRLWPLSKENFPKQFLNLSVNNKNSLKVKENLFIFNNKKIESINGDSLSKEISADLFSRSGKIKEIKVYFEKSHFLF